MTVEVEYQKSKVQRIEKSYNDLKKLYDQLEEKVKQVTNSATVRQQENSLLRREQRVLKKMAREAYQEGITEGMSKEVQTTKM